MKMLTPALCSNCRRFILIRHRKDHLFPVNWYCGKCGAGPQQPLCFSIDYPDTGAVIINRERPMSGKRNEREPTPERMDLP